MKLLLIEDDPGDELITREAFEHNKIKNTLHVARDGEEGLDFDSVLGDALNVTYAIDPAVTGAGLARYHLLDFLALFGLLVADVPVARYGAPVGHCGQRLLRHRALQSSASRSSHRPA